MISIRKGNPNDTEVIAQAVNYVGIDFLPWLFGKKYRKIISGAVNSESCSFSWTNSYIAENKGKVVGVIIAYPSEKEKEMNSGMNDVLKKYYSFFDFISFIGRIKKTLKYFDSPENSYYILAIATFPGHRGKGICGKMLSHVQSIAKSYGCSILSLEVESYNHSAVRAYQKHGFRIHDKVPVEKFSKKLEKGKGSAMLLLRKDI